MPYKFKKMRLKSMISASYNNWNKYKTALDNFKYILILNF